MQDLSVEVSKVINAPIEKVFKAWIDPAQMSQWYHPEGMTTTDVANNAVKDGKYTFVMKWGDKTFPHKGKYLEVDEPNRLVFTWNDEKSTVAIDFTQVGDNQTEVRLVHAGFADEQSHGNHSKGWVGTLNNLDKYF